MRASASAVWFGLAMLVSAQAQASDSAVGAEAGPDIELLEYLGDLVQQKGRWVGPDDMRGLPDEREVPIARDDDAEADVVEDEE